MSYSMKVGLFAYEHHLKKGILAVVLALGLPLATPLGTPLARAAEPEVTADQVVSAIEGVFGVTPGQRRNHIKGTCAACYALEAKAKGMPAGMLYTVRRR